MPYKSDGPEIRIKFLETNKGKLILLIAIVLLIILAFYFQEQREKYRVFVLKKSIETKAVILDADNISQPGSGARFKYKTSYGIKIANAECKCTHLKKGDTIIIRYSLIDTNYVEVTNIDPILIKSYLENELKIK